MEFDFSEKLCYKIHIGYGLGRFGRKDRGFCICHQGGILKSRKCVPASPLVARLVWVALFLHNCVCIAPEENVWCVSPSCTGRCGRFPMEGTRTLRNRCRWWSIGRREHCARSVIAQGGTRPDTLSESVGTIPTNLADDSSGLFYITPNRTEYTFLIY